VDLPEVRDVSERFKLQKSKDDAIILWNVLTLALWLDGQ
jgi:hypothetical protein